MKSSQESAKDKERITSFSNNDINGVSIHYSFLAQQPIEINNDYFQSFQVFTKQDLELPIPKKAKDNK